MRVNDAKLMTFASKGNYHIFLRKNYESRKEKVPGIGRSEGTDSTKFFEYLRVYNAPLMIITFTHLHLFRNGSSLMVNTKMK